MRILQVIPRLNPKFGGGVIVVYNVSKYLARKGHKVTILTSDYGIDQSYIKRMNQEGVEVISLKSRFNLHLFIPTPDIKNWLQNNIQNYDIIHLNGARSYQNIYVSKIAKERGIPFIIQAHGSILPINGYELYKYAYDFIWGKKIVKNCTAFIALNSREVSQYISFTIPNSKIFLVPNGLDLEDYSSMPKTGQFRSKYSLGTDEKIILFLGRLHKIKGLDLLLDAFKDLLNEMKSVKLVIVGPDDGYENELRLKISRLTIEGNVVLTGPLFDEEKKSAYVDADIYVLPSIYETFPNTVLEAWAGDNPVIVTKGCGISDYVNQAGIVINYNKNELRDAMLRLLRHDSLRLILAEKGREILQRELNAEKVTDNLERIYCNLCKSDGVINH